MASLDFDINADGLEKKLLSLANIQVDDIKKITVPAAKIIKNSINDELYKRVKGDNGYASSHNLNRHITHPPLRNEIGTNDDEMTADGSTNVHYSKDGYYYRFVDNGHFVLDNRKGRIKVGKRTVRNYRYKLKTLNTGGKEFGGYHFVDYGVEAKRKASEQKLHEGFSQLLREKGL